MHKELSMWDVEYILPGQTVDTGCLGPCVGVIIYHPQGKEAYAGHFVDPEVDELEKMVQNALSNFPNINHLEVYVAGNSATNVDPQQRTYELQSREYVPRLLKQYGFKESQTHIRWSPDHSVAVMALNVNTGKNKLEVWTDDDLCTILYHGDIKKAPKEIKQQ